MIEKAKGRTYTVADLYAEAGKMVKSEFSAIKKRPLTPAEEIKMQELGKLISRSVLKEMRIA